MRIDDRLTLDDGSGAAQLGVACHREFRFRRPFDRVCVANGGGILRLRAGIGERSGPLIQISGLRIVLRWRLMGVRLGRCMRRGAHFGAGNVKPLRCRGARVRDLRTKRGRHGGDQREQLRL